MEHTTEFNLELKKFVECPKCNKGQIIHVGGNFYCKGSKVVCDFWIPGNFHGAKINQTQMMSLIRNKFIEPMYVGLTSKDGNKEYNAFIVMNNAKLEFKFPQEFKITSCPKCEKGFIIQKHSDSTNSLYYGCDDRTCSFTLPYMFRNKKLNIADIKVLSKMGKLTKTYISSKGKPYTVYVFLDKENLKIITGTV